MGLIAQEIKELRRMIKLFDKGEITAEDVKTKLVIYKETHKRARFALDVHIACNKPHLLENRLHDLNLLSKGEFMQLPDDIEMEMVVCPDQGSKAITRAQCLSFSGDTSNMEICQSCKNFTITRQLLTPPQ